MNEALLFLILLGTSVTIILVCVLLNRLSGNLTAGEKEVREELRMGREEGRTAAKELREEVSAGLRTTSETLSKSLESTGKLQQVQFEGMTKQLKDLTDSNQGALDRIRSTFELGGKELRESNEKKFDDIRKRWQMD